MDYPLNTASLAIRSLSARVKAELLRGLGTAARAAGASHLKGLPRTDDVTGAPTASRPYQVVEFDGHKLDIRLKIVVPDPNQFVSVAVVRTNHESGRVRRPLREACRRG